MGGFVPYRARETIATSGVFSGGALPMLQWKPKLIALVAVLVVIAALLGQFTWLFLEDVNF
jgi:hypothetical protein